jgi:hypothetical protein
MNRVYSIQVEDNKCIHEVSCQKHFLPLCVTDLHLHYNVD